MSDQILLEDEKLHAENSTRAAVKTDESSLACSMLGKGWLKGPVGIAICCGAPFLLLGAISFFGFSLGAIASLVALLACPVGMFLMMYDEREERRSAVKKVIVHRQDNECFCEVVSLRVETQKVLHTSLVYQMGQGDRTETDCRWRKTRGLL
ncbi:MAG TPA: hypothetical protein VGA01_19540 [Candidatus Binatia bacterium]